jgi:arsenite methyltransferase
MNTEQELKNMVKERYARIAEKGKTENASSCCGATSSSNKVYSIMMDDYTGTDGYVKDADLGLGCGLPTQFAKIKKGAPSLIWVPVPAMTVLWQGMRLAQREK